MTTIAILPEITGPTGTTYRAVAGKAQSVGKTPGEAQLDALISQLSESEDSTLVVVQQMRPDRFFTQQQQQRLAELMARWRQSRDSGASWSNDEQIELDGLAQAELQAATHRAAALVRQLNP